VAPDGYLYGVLADGARPFRHRGGVRELLGQPPDTAVRVRFAAAAPHAGFNHLHCYGDRTAGAAVSVPHWLDLVADEEPSASVAETILVIPGITAGPDRSGPPPAHVDPGWPGPSAGAEPKPPGRSRGGHPVAGPLAPQPVNLPASPAAVAPDVYLRGVLADGARPFRHRGGMRELLGQPPDTAVRVRFAAAAPHTGINYLHRHGDRPAGAAVSVPHWLLVPPASPAAVAPESVAAAPVRPRWSGPPPDPPPAAAPPAPAAAAAGRPPTGPGLPAAHTPETILVIPGITARPDRSGPPPAHVDPGWPGPSAGAEPKPPGRSRDGHPVAGPLAPQPVNLPEPPASPAAPTPPAVPGTGDRGQPRPPARDPRPAEGPQNPRTEPASASGPLPASPPSSAPATAPTTAPAPGPVQSPSAAPRPIPNASVGPAARTPQPRRIPTAPTPPAPTRLPAHTPWTPTLAEPPAEPAVTVGGYRRTAAPRAVQEPTDHLAPAPPPPAVSPPAVSPPLAVMSQPEPTPAGTPLFWERRHLTRRARILR
jgi:hypothetical protein